MKRQQTALACIFFLAMLLRCLFIQERGIWYDDAFSFFLSGRSLEEINVGTAADTMPPLYYYLLHFWLMMGHQLWLLRILNIILSTGIVGLLYGVVKQLWGETSGRWAALLAAVSPFQIYHAQELRMYVLLALCLLGYVGFFIRISMRQEKVLYDWAGLVFCGTAALWTHNLAVFTLIIPNFLLLLRRDWRCLRRFIMAQSVMVLLFLPWMYRVPGQIEKIQTAFWTPRPGLVEVLQALVVFTSALPLPGFWLIPAVLLGVEIFVFASLAVWQMYHGFPANDKRRLGIGLMAAFCLLPPVIMFAVSYLMRPIFVPRGFILSSLVYYGFGGLVIATSQPRWLGGLVATGFLLGAVIGLPFQYRYDHFPRSPFRAATAYLEENRQAGELIIHDNKISYFPALFYAPDLPQVFLADAPGSHNDTLSVTTSQALGIFPQPDLENAIKGYRKIKFIVFSRAISEYRAAGLPQHPALAWLNDHFSLQQQRIFNDLEIYEYDVK